MLGYSLLDFVEKKTNVQLWQVRVQNGKQKLVAHNPKDGCGKPTRTSNENTTG